MDENRADFLIVGGGLAGNLLANRIHNAIEWASIKPIIHSPYFNSRHSRKASTEPPKIVIVERDPDGVEDREKGLNVLHLFKISTFESFDFSKLRFF